MSVFFAAACSVKKEKKSPQWMKLYFNLSKEFLYKRLRKGTEVSDYVLQEGEM